ncbi:MAG: glucose-6-phosphate dehydrogenase (coenzyme-F420) [Chloroflexi bacterium]|nr:MAG: glucose-6-phosphate dehydrogenase (coenzyme-F420) [Chloroflexota bacterium]TME04651.1 MAG: glucose-6-phosphate dehydrogenase (coenzyme-F420) [Chloroflexota bacterium]TME37949.1 MAG: glucose-6-phosphate dehydrogenase (coenzyme-F420) [Chloroflexota bacterium]TME52811.1 MAG: glucose-6-phosphate dehydrogenase (coenzyme-F420) [Chloroflexota bacterium]
MPPKLRLGYKASAEQFGPRELLDFAIAAEATGFDSVFVSDHFQPWRHSDGHAPFAFAWLAAAGERTSRVALGTSVVTPTFRYHPAIVAQAFGTLGVLLPGRMVLGVGTGEHLNEGALGVQWPDNRERFARLREAVKLIRLLWTEQSVTFDGDYFHTKNATIYDRPAESVPIYIGAGGPQVAKFAGRAGDGLICTSGKGMELYSEQLLPSFSDGAKESGRDAGELDRMIEVKVSYDTDRKRAMEDTKIWAALALPAEAKAGIDDPREMERLARTVEDVAHRRWLVASDPDEHIEQLRPYLDLGFNHLVFHSPGDGQARFLELYGAQILPRIRKRWG